MAEFNIADVKKVLEKLKLEIVDSVYKQDAKEDLVSVLEVVVNTPNLLKENDKLAVAILKKRTELGDIEAMVDREAAIANTRMQELKEHVLAEETETAMRQGEEQSKRQDNIKETDREVNRYKEIGEEKKGEIAREVAEAKEKLDNITTETDAAQARLKLFKENVANMNVADA